MVRCKTQTIMGFLGVAALCVAGMTGCSGSSTSTTTTDTETEDGSSVTVTISGQALVSASDAALSSSQPLARMARGTPQFDAIGDTALTAADVTLVKILADATEEEITTTTTDADGAYTLSEVPVCVTGTGAATPFFF